MAASRRRRDVAILLPGADRRGAIYEQALADEGLDYHVIGGSAFFAQQEVLDLINLLSASRTRSTRCRWPATLRSPFFGVSDDGLYWLATPAGEQPTCSGPRPLRADRRAVRDATAVGRPGVATCSIAGGR